MLNRIFSFIPFYQGQPAPADDQPYQAVAPAEPPPTDTSTAVFQSPGEGRKLHKLPANQRYVDIGAKDRNEHISNPLSDYMMASLPGFGVMSKNVTILDPAKACDELCSAVDSDSDCGYDSEHHSVQYDDSIAGDTASPSMQTGAASVQAKDTSALLYLGAHQPAKSKTVNVEPSAADRAVLTTKRPLAGNAWADTGAGCHAFFYGHDAGKNRIMIRIPQLSPKDRWAADGIDTTGYAPHPVTRKTALQMICELDSRQAIRELDWIERNRRWVRISPEAEVNRRDFPSGEFPLHALVKQKNVYLFDRLVTRYGANTEVKDLQGRTPLMLAADMNYEEFLQLQLPVVDNSKSSQ